MNIYTDDKGNIKAVHTTDDTSLTEYILSDEGNPFDGWSDDKICCYRVQVNDGRVVMMTPYLDSRLIEHFDLGGKEHTDNSEGIFDLADIVADLEERLIVLEEAVNGK